MLSDLFNMFIGATGFMAVVLGCIELASPKRRLVQVWGCGLFVSVGLGMIADFINHSAWFVLFPHSAYANDCLEFFMGAFFYHYFRALCFPQRPMRKRSLLLFVPCLVNLGLYLPLLFQSGEFKRTHFPLELLGDIPLAPYYWLINQTVEVWVIFCLLLFMVNFSILFDWKKSATTLVSASIKNQRRIFRIYGLAWILVLSAFMWLNFHPNPLIHRGVIALACFLAILVYFLLQRNREFLENLRQNFKPSRYQVSKLKGIDIQEILQKLDEQMDTQKLYRNPDLTLESLSTVLGINAHQLSEILNGQLDTSFRPFINNYRIALAKRRLLSEPDRTILEIAFDCGFNTKSNFNAVFAKLVGFSPSQFRENAINGTS